VAEKRIDLGYDAASQWQTITRYADLVGTKLVATSQYTYDAAGRLTGLNHMQGSTTLAGYAWQYDIAGRVTQFASLLDGTVDYTYDDTNQLTGADYDYSAGGGLPTAPLDENYTYDANGNRTTGGYVTGPNNQLLSDGTYNYQYDGEGNRTRRTNIATGEVTEYEWDHRNRLVKITDRDASETATKVVEYSYDFQNRRLAKAIDSNGDGIIDSAPLYIYDGERHERGHAGDHIALLFDGNGTLTNRYLHGPAVDQILADEQLDEILRTTAPGNVLWPLTDNLGTVRDLAQYEDATGITDVVNHLTYGAFGRVASESNAAVDHIFEFTGREKGDDLIALQYNRERYYDSRLG
jgi:YD repeat-containing protein